MYRDPAVRLRAGFAWKVTMVHVGRDPAATLGLNKHLAAKDIGLMGSVFFNL